MFENLSEVKKASTRETKGPRRASFTMKIIEAKSTIIFSNEQFIKMNIADNSLSQFNDETKKIVFLALMPGNSGTFAKTNQRGTKGKRFRNTKLVESLIEYGYDLTNIGLHELGTEDGKTLYQITGNNAELIQAENQSSLEVDVPTNAKEEEVSFEARKDEPIIETDPQADVAKEEAIEDALSSGTADELEF